MDLDGSTILPVSKADAAALSENTNHRSITGSTGGALLDIKRSRIACHPGNAGKPFAQKPPQFIEPQQLHVGRQYRPRLRSGLAALTLCHAASPTPVGRFP